MVLFDVTFGKWMIIRRYANIFAKKFKILLIIFSKSPVIYIEASKII